MRAITLNPARLPGEWRRSSPRDVFAFGLMRDVRAHGMATLAASQAVTAMMRRLDIPADASFAGIATHLKGVFLRVCGADESVIATIDLGDLADRIARGWRGASDPSSSSDPGVSVGSDMLPTALTQPPTCTARRRAPIPA